MKIVCTLLLVLAFVCPMHAQEHEVAPPYNIKSAAFVQNGQTVVPIFPLGDNFTFEFDDLFGDEANYYFQVVHCDYDWQPSQLNKAEYITGLDDQRIVQYLNSFNTLQLYSHYTLPFPNKFMRFRVSGNYILKILNDDHEVVFSRKFILYENLVSVPMQVKRARQVRDVNFKHNLEFSIKSTTINFQSPLQNVKVMLLQNGRFDNAITNVKPMFTMGNDLIYRYDRETQFWAGNEFLWFENKDVRAATNFVGRIDANETYNAYLYTHEAAGAKPYTFAPDKNGWFLPMRVNSQDPNIESDYVWTFFTLSAPAYFGKSDVYITGMFNNYALTPEFKMEYNEKKAVYEKAVLIKQGFTNYQYVLADATGKIDFENALDGNFYQTENDYFAIVYYRENGQRYDRVVGKGVASSVDIVN
ncbi:MULTISPECIES: DUF5103 domain-containing protein [unclassified Flavobacterium]|uniref:type IX secretion system plug protein n=1 Tax=unclassified Flavobacterium TaxID=196869 RepID=UPI001F13CE60|nr:MULTISPECIES: DUF5103 domain-containing protein [unclassified Flavobacterium]UMY66777.1 DUF5103 domain-containing protein [Flavobacterium sp. HJ-32-4]